MSKTDGRWRVGNFVVRECNVPTLGEEDWSLSDAQIRKKVRSGEIGVVECFEVSSLDGAWMVRVMPGSQMHVLLSQAVKSGADAGREWLELVVTNLMQVSLIPNGYFHQGLLLLSAAYYAPELLKGGMFSRERRAFAKDVKRVREGFLRWYEESEREREALYTEDDSQERMRYEAEEVLEKPQ